MVAYWHDWRMAWQWQARRQRWTKTTLFLPAALLHDDGVPACAAPLPFQNFIWRDERQTNRRFGTGPAKPGCSFTWAPVFLSRFKPAVRPSVRCHAMLLSLPLMHAPPISEPKYLLILPGFSTRSRPSVPSLAEDFRVVSARESLHFITGELIHPISRCSLHL